MFSIGDLVDKLVIENIKIYNLREKLLTKNPSDKKYVDIYTKMMVMVENRAIISNSLDDKINKVVNDEEENIFLKRIRTYND